MIKPAEHRWSTRLSGLIAALALILCGWQRPPDCPTNEWPQPARATVVAPQRRIVVQPNATQRICAAQANQQGPDLDYLYESHGGTIVRTTGLREMQRYDVLKTDGWRDWSWQDVRARKITFVDAADKSKVSPVGKSSWPHRFGPTIPAASNCTSCHRTRGVRLGVGVDVALLLKAGSTEARLGLDGWLGSRLSRNGSRPTRQPVKADNCPKSPTGRMLPQAVVTGPRGPVGPPGPKGDTPAIDYDRIVRSVLAALPSQPAGPTEEQLVAIIERVIRSHQADVEDMIAAEIDEALANQNPIDYDAIAARVQIDYDKIASRIPTPSAPQIDYDDIASRVKVPAQTEINYTEITEEVKKRLKPLYIGAKQIDQAGTLRITMEAVPVKLGDTVYVHIDPPKFDYDAIATEVKKKLDQPE